MDALTGYLIFCVAASSLGIGDGQIIKSMIGFRPNEDKRKIFNLYDFGAAGDGRTDDTESFLKGWAAICKEDGTGDIEPTLRISRGTYLLQPVKFEGPCKATRIGVEFEALATIIAPKRRGQWKDYSSGFWIGFSTVTNLSIYGEGKIDGQGWTWWNFFKQGKKDDRPTTALHFHNCNNLQLSRLTHTDSPKGHIGISSCASVLISNLQIIAPAESPNTDGIDIAQSTQVAIQNSFIGTGDDCVAINSGSSYINITNVTCGPGHGISVGSLGKNGANETVEHVYVMNCTFDGSDNGARIKTWQGGSGFAREIYFVQIRLKTCKCPIVIDQSYCPEGGCKNESTAVAVSNVTYREFQGTSGNDEAIKLKCSDCTNIVMDRVNISSSVPGGNTFASCQSASGESYSTTPPVPCLRAVNTE